MQIMRREEEILSLMLMASSVQCTHHHFERVNSRMANQPNFLKMNHSDYVRPKNGIIKKSGKFFKGNIL